MVFYAIEQNLMDRSRCFNDCLTHFADSKEDVVNLQVSVHNALRVQIMHSGQNLDPKEEEKDVEKEVDT